MGFDFSNVPNIEGLTNTTGTEKYLNSGVGAPGPEVPSRWGEVIAVTMPKLPSDFFRVGPRFYAARLEMGSNYTQLPPHTHGGGELAFVEDGEYFDADMAGGRIRTYPAREIVFYAVGSTHRPLSDAGAKLRYVTFDGLLELRGSAEEHLQKLQKIGTPENAVEWALLLLVPDEAERRRLQEQFFKK